MTELYNLRQTQEPGQYLITKFDKYMNVESSYLVSHDECACPQAHKPTCRHRKMLFVFKQAQHINDGWFLDWNTRKWIEPVNDDVDAHNDAPATDEPEVVVLPPASAPVPSRPSSSVAGAPSKLWLRPL
jgi:hypothetical protein